MALDATGLTIPTLQEIKAQLAEDLQTNLGLPIDATSESSNAGIINSIFAAAISDVYELVQATYTQRTREGATDVNLDDLMAYTNTYRLPAQQSTCDVVHFTGDEGTTVPQNSVVQNPSTLSEWLVTGEVNISAQDCYSVTLSVSSVLNNTDYDIAISGTNYSFTSSGSATEGEILDGLETAFSGSTGFTGYRVDDTFVITSSFEAASFSASMTTYLAIEEVTSVGAIISKEVGSITGPIGSITKILSPKSGWVSVENRQAAIDGRDRETDEELLERQAETTAVAVAGTPDAITNLLRAHPGVVGAFIVENNTNTLDADFRDAHSFEAVVSGGVDEEIAQLLWDSHPASIKLVGSETETAYDIDGNPKQVNFSRPEEIYIHVRVTYTLYNEEIFPASGEATIKDAVFSTGSALDIDEDVIPKRFYGGIYSAIAGVEDLVVEMTTTNNPGDTPVGFSSAPIEIGFKETSNFDLSRITIVGP